MPPSKEAIVKQIEHDRDFALCCLNRKLTDAPTIRRLVGEMKAQGFKNCLSDLMVSEGILDSDAVSGIETELAEKKASTDGKSGKADRPSSVRKNSLDSSSTPLIPEFAFGEVLSERAGTLYKVRARAATQDECLRVLPKALKENAELKNKFRLAYNKIKGLQHPMLCGLGDLIENEHHLYYTTEFVDGPTLDDVLRQNRPFPGPVALGFVKVLSGVLDHAHQNGVIHRDLHPSALVFLPNRQMRFNDFGLERVVIDLLQQDEPESIRCFRSPEDLKKSPPHVADDLFGIGALLYFVVTGTRPPRATSSGNVALPNLQKTAPHLPPDIISIITRLLLPRLARISSIPELTQALNKPMTRSYGRSRADEFLNKSGKKKANPLDSPMPTQSKAEESDGAETIMLSFGSSPVPSENPNNQSFETAGNLWDADPSDTTIKENISPSPAKANPWDFNPNQAIAEAEHNLLETIREKAPPATLRGNDTIRETFSMPQPGLPGQVPSAHPSANPPFPSTVPSSFDPNAATIRDLDVKQVLQGGPPKTGGSFDFSAPMPSSQNFGPGSDPDASTLIAPHGRNPDAEETALPNTLPTLKAMQAAHSAGTDPFAETVAPLSDPNAETIVPAFPGSSKAPKFEDYQNF
ncbi:MAG: protein kinase, partial [Planctomycetota bacterium]|nr:protein kinase [Planctomycetota bacterium]